MLAYLCKVNFTFFLTLLFICFEYWRLSAQYPILSDLYTGKILSFLCITASFFYNKNKKLTCGYKIIIWLTVCFASIAFAISPSHATKTFTELLCTSAIYFIVARSIDDLQKLTIFLILFAVVHLKLSLWQLKNYSSLIQGDFASYHIREGVGGGSTGFLGNAGDFGVALCIVIPLTLTLLILIRSNLIKFLFLIILNIFCLSIISTGSRATALGLTLSGFSAPFFSRKVKWMVLCIIIVLISVTVLWHIAPEEYRSRFYGITNYEQDRTASQRLDLWTGGFEMFLDNCFTGVGIGNFPIAWEDTYKPPNYDNVDDRYSPANVSHNNFISALAETGIFGFIFYCIVIFSIIKVNYESMQCSSKSGADNKKISFTALMIIISAISFIVTGFFITTIYYPHIFLIAGLTDALSNIKEKCNALEC